MTATVTSRVVAVLAAFDAQHPCLTLSDISRRSGACVVGRRLWQLGLLAPVQLELRQVALPFLQDLYDATRENVHLAVLDRGQALYVEYLAGRAAVPIVSRAGVRLPLRSTAVGKVPLAHAEAEVVEQVLRAPEAVTAHTVVEPGALRRQLALVRSRGYATAAQEMTVGTYPVAAPVLHDGRVVAAVGVVTTTARRDLARLAPAVQVAAAGTSRRLAGAVL